jgi:hypothetical protein
VPTPRLLAIFELLAKREKSAPHSGVLCAVAAQITEQSGAGIALLSKGDQLTSMCTSNKMAASLMDLEITAGAGPCADACRSDGAIVESDLDQTPNLRWLGYTPQAVSLGVGAVFAFPVRIGAVRLGALVLYRDLEGAMTEVQEANAYLMAAVIARAVLALQARALSGSLATALEREASFDFLVHQAAGMVAVQGSMTLGDALVILRSHAYALTANLTDTAGRVVARELWYEPKAAVWRNAYGRAE